MGNVGYSDSRSFRYLESVAVKKTFNKTDVPAVNDPAGVADLNDLELLRKSTPLDTFKSKLDVIYADFNTCSKLEISSTSVNFSSIQGGFSGEVVREVEDEIMLDIKNRQIIEAVFDTCEQFGIDWSLSLKSEMLIDMFEGDNTLDEAQKRSFNDNVLSLCSLADGKDEIKDIKNQYMLNLNPEYESYAKKVFDFLLIDVEDVEDVEAKELIDLKRRFESVEKEKDFIQVSFVEKMRDPKGGKALCEGIIAGIFVRQVSSVALSNYHLAEMARQVPVFPFLKEKSYKLLDLKYKNKNLVENYKALMKALDFSVSFFDSLEESGNPRLEDCFKSISAQPECLDFLKEVFARSDFHLKQDEKARQDLLFQKLRDTSDEQNLELLQGQLASLSDEVANRRFEMFKVQFYDSLPFFKLGALSSEFDEVTYDGRPLGPLPVTVDGVYDAIIPRDIGRYKKILALFINNTDPTTLLNQKLIPGDEFLESTGGTSEIKNEGVEEIRLRYFQHLNTIKKEDGNLYNKLIQLYSKKTLDPISDDEVRLMKKFIEN